MILVAKTLADAKAIGAKKATKIIKHQIIYWPLEVVSKFLGLLKIAPFWLF